MPKRPPLTKADLEAIKDRNPGNPDVVALLWEIHRFRQLTLRVREYLITEKVEERNELLRETITEPVVVESSPGQVYGDWKAP